MPVSHLPPGAWPLVTGLLTCSALSHGPVAEISTVSYHTQKYTSFRERGHENATLSGPCLSSFPSLCAIGVIENQFIKVKVPRAGLQPEQKPSNVFDWSFEVIHSGWDLNRGKTFTENKTGGNKSILAPQMNT